MVRLDTREELQNVLQYYHLYLVFDTETIVSIPKTETPTLPKIRCFFRGI